MYRIYRTVCFGLLAVLLTPTFSLADELTLYTELLPPFNLYNDVGEIVGSSTDVVNRLLTRLNVDYKIVLESWQTGYQHTLNTPNTGIFSIVPNSERQPLFKWVGPINHISEYFVAKKSIKVNRDDLSKHIIGDYEDAFTNNLLRKAGFTVKIYSRRDKLFYALATDAVDLVLSADPQADLAHAGLNPNQFQILPIPFVKADLYLAFNLSIPDDLVSKMNAELARMQQPQDAPQP